MNRRLFFLQQEGWFEVEIAGKLLQAKDDELARWAYGMMDRYGYRNYWISENPEPSLRGGSSMQPFSDVDFSDEAICPHRQCVTIVATQKQSVSMKRIASSAIK
jgi:hypothetical protein